MRALAAYGFRPPIVRVFGGDRGRSEQPAEQSGGSTLSYSRPNRLGTVEIMRRTGGPSPASRRWEARYLEARRRRALCANRPAVADPAARRRTVVERSSPAPWAPPPGRATPTGPGAMARDIALARLGAADLGRPRAAARTGSRTLSSPRASVRPPSCATSSASTSKPASASLVFSVDEKSKIQALDRTQPGCR